MSVAVFGLLTGALFSYHVGKYYFLGDDCFISFRYARNLAEGHGLVFNPQERVEGYTNFSWVLICAAVIKLGLPVEIVSNVLGILSGATVLLLLARFGARRNGWREPWLWIAPLALAGNRTFAAWSTGGLETQFFTLLVFAAYLRFVIERGADPRRPWVSSLLFALAALTRPEGIMFFGVAWLFFAVDCFLRRRPLRAWVIWTLIFAAIVGTHVTWRYAYYGYLVPNTFYAKVSGLWFEQGWAYINFFLDAHQLYWLAPLPLLLLVLRRDYCTCLFLSVVVAFSAYLLYVGGDRFEFRFVDTILPQLFWLLQEAVREIVGRLSALRRGRAWAPAVGGVLGLLVIAAGLRPNFVEYKKIGRTVNILESIGAYAARRAENGRFLRSLVEDGYLSGDELIAVGGAGALPYYSRLPTLDTHGLSDLRVAHMEIPERGPIGHEKTAPYEYLVERRVVMHDVLNRLVLPPNAPAPRRSDFVRVTLFRRFEGEPLHCVEAKGRYMVFGTTLSEQEFRRVFVRFRIVF